MKTLILASTSRYRRALLERLGLDFEPQAPGVDETALPDEPPRALAERLAAAKAKSIDAPQALVIGSDQVAALHGKLLRKPGHHDAALRQLLACQGQWVSFYTAVVIVDTGEQRSWKTVDETRVRFAELEPGALDRYLKREQAYDCAGGFKAEGLGITLFERIESTDPTALMGLPLIWVAQTLRRAGHDPLGDFNVGSDPGVRPRGV